MKLSPFLPPHLSRTGSPHPEFWQQLAERAHFRSRELARLLQRSDRQLRRYCRSQFGCSAQAWLNEQRLLAAGELLRTENCVKVVAYDLGFRCVSHFSRAFKLRYGVPPSRFAPGRDRAGRGR